jgi:predicted secreted acid phosphatase
MRLQDELNRWMSTRHKPKTLICDIDETLCTQFDQPIEEALTTIEQLPKGFPIHYVTARPESAKEPTIEFLERCGLPTPERLYLCPNWSSTLRHKCRVFQDIAQEYDVLYSIGDASEDEQASEQAAIPFLKIDLEAPAESWKHVQKVLLTELTKTA